MRAGSPSSSTASAATAKHAARLVFAPGESEPAVVVRLQRAGGDGLGVGEAQARERGRVGFRLRAA